MKKLLKPILYVLCAIAAVAAIPFIGNNTVNTYNMSLLGEVELPDFMQKFVASAYDWFKSLGIKNPDTVLIIIAVVICLILIAAVVFAIVIFARARGYGSADKIKRKELDTIKKEKREHDSAEKKAVKYNKKQAKKTKNTRQDDILTEQSPILENKEAETENILLIRDDNLEKIAIAPVNDIAINNLSHKEETQNEQIPLDEIDVNFEESLNEIDIAPIEEALLEKEEIESDEIADIIDLSAESKKENTDELIDLSEFTETSEKIEPDEGIELLDLTKFDVAEENVETEEKVNNKTELFDFSAIEENVIEDKEISEAVPEPTIDFENLDEFVLEDTVTDKTDAEPAPTYQITPEIAKLIAKIEKESLKQKSSTEEINEKIFGGKKIYIPRDSVILPKCFESMLKQADDSLKQIYDRLKNELLSYEDVHSRMITGFEVFRRGCAQARFAIKGKTLYAYLRVDPSSVSSDMVKSKDYSGKKALEDTPTEIRVSGKKKINICVDIIAAMFAAQDIKKKKEYTPENFSKEFPYVEKGVIYSNNLLYKD